LVSGLEPIDYVFYCKLVQLAQSQLVVYSVTNWFNWFSSDLVQLAL
jgi:hypothetical protein